MPGGGPRPGEDVTILESNPSLELTQAIAEFRAFMEKKKKDPKVRALSSVRVVPVRGFQKVFIDGEEISNISHMEFDAQHQPFVVAQVDFVPDEICVDLPGNVLICRGCGQRHLEIARPTKPHWAGGHQHQAEPASGPRWRPASERRSR
jgi:hypothetical protein